MTNHHSFNPENKCELSYELLYLLKWLMDATQSYPIDTTFQAPCGSRGCLTQFMPSNRNAGVLSLLGSRAMAGYIEAVFSVPHIEGLYI